jgi:hypothetical protein
MPHHALGRLSPNTGQTPKGINQLFNQRIIHNRLLALRFIL